MPQVDMIAELKNGPTYDHAVICTYQFDAEFFEQYALRQCKAFNRCRSITILADESDYQRICEEEDLKDVNRAYLLHGMTAPGKFHPKMILLVSTRRGKLIVGSANFTKSGLMQNAEMVHVYNYDDDHPEARSIFLDAFRMLVDLSAPYPGSTLQSNLEELERATPWLQDKADPEYPDTLVSNTKVCLLDQIYEAIGNVSIEEYITVSPFFDSGLLVISAIAESLHPALITIITQDHTTTLPTDTIDQWRASHPSVILNVKLIRFQSDQERRTLHAKLHIFRTQNKCICLSGSANCTSSAMLRTAQNGNVEFGILSKEVKQHDADHLLREFAQIERVTDLTSIERRANEPQRLAVRYPIDLQEVRYENREQLIVTAKSTTSSSLVGLTLMVSIADTFRTPLSKLGKSVILNINPQIQTGLEVGSARARILDEEGNSLSNWRWIENIQEDSLPTRLARDWRDSTTDANKFYAVLNTLIASDDIERLIDFLTWCNIPIEGFTPRMQHSLVREVATPGQLGKRAQERLPDIMAALWHFYELHIKKLEKHAQYPDRERVTNFLHIYQTVTLALRGCWRLQITNVTKDGLVIPLDEWHMFVESAGKILNCYSELLDPLQSYATNLGGLRTLYKGDTPLLEQLLKDIYMLHSEWLDEAQQKLNELFHNYTTQNVAGIQIGLPYNEHDDITPINWASFRKMLDERIHILKKV